MPTGVCSPDEDLVLVVLVNEVMRYLPESVDLMRT